MIVIEELDHKESRLKGRKEEGRGEGRGVEALRGKEEEESR